MILDADIKSFFPTISHGWMLDNIPIDSRILKSFLKAGVMFQGSFTASEMGVAIGSPISPIISNMVLDGLQEAISKAASSSAYLWMRDSTVMVRYADDFLVIGANLLSKRFMTKLITDAINTFLSERGLSLSVEKTKLVHRTDGFDFLGYTIR